MNLRGAAGQVRREGNCREAAGQDKAGEAGMKLYEKKEACCGCSACRDICPVGAIHMISDEEGFRYPRVDEEKCIQCGRCEQVCPIKGEKAGRGENFYFGAQAKDETLRRASSSGGMFPVLAEYVFRRQGVVFGAAFNENMEVVHKEAWNPEELEALKKTKYVQSNPEGIYRRVQEHLKEDRWVLFCGTPCQAHALRLFLKKPYPKLIIADLVCYGAPSPGVWASYVKYLERKSGGKMTRFYFRDKRNKDNGHTCAYVAGGREQAHSLYGDVYCRMYFANQIIRPSCHACKYCTVDRDSDFTIGDFWGIEKVRPEMEDGMGTSLVIIHRSAAREIWEQVKEELRWFACKEQDVLQPRLTSPTPAGRGRKRFMYFYRALPFPVFRFLFIIIMNTKTLLGRIVKG